MGCGEGGGCCGAPEVERASDSASTRRPAGASTSVARGCMAIATAQVGRTQHTVPVHCARQSARERGGRKGHCGRAGRHVVASRADGAAPVAIATASGYQRSVEHLNRRQAAATETAATWLLPGCVAADGGEHWRTCATAVSGEGGADRAEENDADDEYGGQRDGRRHSPVRHLRRRHAGPLRKGTPLSVGRIRVLAVHASSGSARVTYAGARFGSAIAHTARLARMFSASHWRKTRTPEWRSKRCGVLTPVFVGSGTSGRYAQQAR